MYTAVRFGGSRPVGLTDLVTVNHNSQSIASASLLFNVNSVLLLHVNTGDAAGSFSPAGGLPGHRLACYKRSHAVCLNDGPAPNSTSAYSHGGAPAGRQQVPLGACMGMRARLQAPGLLPDAVAALSPNGCRRLRLTRFSRPAAGV